LLEQALDALEADHQLLLKSDVFSNDVVETYVGYDRRSVGRRAAPEPFERALRRYGEP
jgi:glutamine synthetase